MATVAFTREFPNSLNQLCPIITWANMANNDDGAPVELAQYADRSVQITGVFAGASCVIEGSNDGVNYATLTDPQGNALTLSSAKIEAVIELVRYLRPRVTGGDGTTNLTITMLMRGFAR